MNNFITISSLWLQEVNPDADKVGIIFLSYVSGRNIHNEEVAILTIFNFQIMFNFKAIM